MCRTNVTVDVGSRPVTVKRITVGSRHDSAWHGGAGATDSSAMSDTHLHPSATSDTLAAVDSGSVRASFPLGYAFYATIHYQQR